MASTPSNVRVLYSFPHKIGAGRICTTAWQQVFGAVQAGTQVTLLTGTIAKPVPGAATTTTLSLGKLRLPYRIFGSRRACMIHDWIVARKLKDYQGKIDAVHVWPLGALRTIAEARRLGLPTLLERPNAHTRFAYEIVQDECRKLGIAMPKGHEHDYDGRILAHEEKEYQQADYLLCPSDFVAKTFIDEGYPQAKLLRHHYGFDQTVYSPPATRSRTNSGLRAIFVGGCAPRKGLHYALDAWLASSAHKTGKFLIAGAFIPGYAELLHKQLSHPSIESLGHRNDVAELMRGCDILTLPSIEEGSALVTSEARGSGCVLLVSDASGAICKHGVDGFIHKARDLGALTEHFNLLDSNRTLLESMRAASLSTVDEITWEAAGRRLHQIYTSVRRG